MQSASCIAASRTGVNCFLNQNGDFFTFLREDIQLLKSVLCIDARK